LALILGTSFAIGFALGIGEVLAGVPEDEYLIEEIILLYAIITPVGIFFMRKWSREWNEKILRNE